MPGFTAHLKAQLQKRRIPLVSHVTFTEQERDAPLGESPLIRPPGFWVGKHRRPFVCFTQKSLDHWNREVIEGQLKMLTACVSTKQNTTNIFHILPLELLENLYKAQLNVGNYVRACVLPVGQFDMIDYIENDYNTDTVVRLLEINYPLGVEVVPMPVDLRGDFARERLKLQELTDHIKSQNMAKESDLLLLSERLVQLRRDATVRDTDLSSKIEALEELLRETQGQLGDSKAHGARVRNSPER